MKSACLIFSFGLLLLQSACSPEQKPTESGSQPQETPAQSWPATQPTEKGGYEVTIQPAGLDAIERNEHFSLEITLQPKSDGEGASADGPALRVDADMPSHRHGMNTKPEVTRKGPNHYQADGMLFHMGGDWVITVELGEAGAAETASFPINVE